MPITRRSILSLVGAAALSRPALADSAATAPDPYSERGLGSVSAPVVAHEYYSLTCPHCGDFATNVMPQVKQNLIDTGKLRMVFHPFPRDQVDLHAFMVALYLPANQYYPFIEALFASQNEWAFAANVNYQDAIYKYAVLAGMDKQTFDTAWNDDKLAKYLVAAEFAAQKQYNLEYTPTFIINGRVNVGFFDYPAFAALVAKAAGG